MATPDPSLRSCKTRPPKPTITSQTDVAVLITDLFAWGDDCESKLGSTWKSIDDATAKADAANKAATPQ